MTNWRCGHCSVTAVTADNARTQYHNCTGLHGLTAPLTVEGVDCTTVAVVREDYVGRETPQFGSNGTPYMAIKTVYGSGRVDVALLATAVVSSGEVG